MKYNNILKRKKHGSRVRCEKCGKIKRMRFMAVFDGKVLCSSCKPHKIAIGNGYKTNTKEVDVKWKTKEK